jgi:truncated hemoglobin YjbI
LLHLFGVGGFALRVLAYEALYLHRRKGVYAELRDQWLACLRAGLKHLFLTQPANPPATQLAEAAPSPDNPGRAAA